MGIVDPCLSRFAADSLEEEREISIMRITIKTVHWCGCFGHLRPLSDLGLGLMLVEIVVDSCVAFLVSQRASAEGIWATLLFIGGLEPCAFFLAKHFLTDVTFHQAVTQKEFDLFCKTYNIPANLGPELPGPEDTIKDSPERETCIYTRLIEFANFRIPLSKFLLCVLQYYQINFSQLFVLAAAKVSHFEIMCRVLGHQPSLGTFRRFYSSSINNGWLPFSKRASVPCCTSKPLDYLKGWNDHFFWIDASVCPIFIPWYNNVSVKKDPLPSDDIVDFELLEKLDNNCTMITKYPETLMCLVGFILSFSDPTARPTLICRDKSDTGLLDFVKSSDSSKIKTEERTFTPGEVPLLAETADMVVNPSPQMIRLVTHTIADEINAYFGKNKRKVGASAGPPPIKKARTGGANVDSEAVSSLAEEFVSSSITPTPKRDYEDESVSNHDDNILTFLLFPKLFCPSLPCKSMLILWLLSLWMKLMVRLFLGRRLGDRPFLRTRQGLPSAAPDQGSPVDDFYDSQTIDYATAQNIYVPNWDVTNNARMDDPIICRNLVDHVPPSGYWASLCNLSNADFLDRMNLNSAQHVCMVFELRLCYEHEIALTEKFEKKFTNSSEVIQQRDAEVVELTSKLERAEGEAADVVSGLEFVRDGLKGNAVKLEFECERLRSQVERAVCGNVGCRDIIYETEKNKSLVSATPLSTAFISTSVVQDFQDSPDDEEDTRSSHEYLNDLEEEYQA
ncbi:hypothetical protein Tco_0128159 [Tanacetum coccineum]